MAAALNAGRSEQLVAFLKCMSRFHRYSFSNVLLLAAQKPDVTRVAGYRRWQQLGRHVRKGEKGLAIFAPLVSRKKRAEAEPDLRENLDDIDDTKNVRRVVRSRVRCFPN